MCALCHVFWELWTVVLEKTLESPLDHKEIKPVNPEGNQSWIFIGRTDGEAETPILWSPDEKTWLIWKDPVAGKDWRWEEKGMTEDEMVVWHHWLSECELGQTSEDSERQRGLVCCNPWGRKELDMTATELTDWLTDNEFWSTLSDGLLFYKTIWEISLILS